VRRGLEAKDAPLLRIDFNKPSHRYAAMVFGLVSVVLVFVGGVGSYQLFHYSESVQFCGETCHEVMKPENVAYHNSPHARVPCAECHIGTGAGWWAKSKLSGAYQVYSVLADKYPKPIPTPIANLRPAQETCEQCHWPEKFFGAQQKRFDHYMYDEENTHWPINLLIKTGGGDEENGLAHGIHWHMNIGFNMEYIARDYERQDIPWVRIKDTRTGRVTVYQDEENPLSEEEIAVSEIRLVDCMDCHNRPSHVYYSPDHAIDKALFSGKIDANLPDIKRVAVEAMDREFTTEREALDSVASYIADYYQVAHPDLIAQINGELDKTILAIQDVFKQNIFPEMKVNWKEYPSNLGHFESPGCFRCHNDKLVSATQKRVTTDCRSCHTILSQGSGENRQISTSVEGLEFQHPEDIDEEWRETGCFDCHSGVQP
jgi:nitrate/TMAO reductase-like tetraheme cytochrome c subunit